MDWSELVNFERNDSDVLQDRGIELAAPTGADEEIALAVKVKADGQHHRQDRA